MTAFLTALAADRMRRGRRHRTGRNDPFFTRLSSGIFWRLSKVCHPGDAAGGVDVFGCNRMFRDQLLRLEESRSSLIALIFWMDSDAKLVGYERQERQEGRSSWTLSKRIDYDGQCLCIYGSADPTGDPHRADGQSWRCGAWRVCRDGEAFRADRGALAMPPRCWSFCSWAPSICSRWGWSEPMPGEPTKIPKRRPTAIVAMARTNRKDHP